MPAWLPPAFTAPCRKPQADTLDEAMTMPSDFLRKLVPPRVSGAQQCGKDYTAVLEPVGHAN